MRARHQRVADAQGAALDQDRHDRATAGIELGLDHRARRVRLLVGAQLLEVGDDLDRVEQAVEALMRLGADVHELDIAPPLRRLQASLAHLRAHPFGLRALLVDLVHRDHDRHLGRARVVDRLLGLRLDSVVGCDHDHREVRHARAARAHRRERFVARRVQEGDLAPAVVHLVGADVLRYPTRLARGHLGLANRVQQRGLAVVDVAHDRDHRRALDEVLLGVLKDRLAVDVVGRVHDLDLLVELVGQHLDGVV